MKTETNHFLFTGLLGLVFMLSSCGSGSENQQAQPGQQAQPYPVVTVPSKSVTSYTSYPASLEGQINSDVRPKATGFITAVLVDEGQKVRKGQVMFRLETEALTQDAAAAKANVDAAQVEVDKLRPLVEKNIISNVQLETAKARLAQARSTYNAIRANIDYATVRSPVDGFVGAIALREGALVSPSSQTPLTTVADIRKMYAFFTLNEKEYLDFVQKAPGKTLSEKIKNLPKVRLVLANGQIYGHEGRIETINPQVSSSTGTVSFRAIFDNPERMLSSGFSGKIQIPQSYTDAVVVPAMSIFERQGVTYVYKVQGDTLAVSSSIQIADKVDNLLIVSEGVQAGDKIVAQGVGKLRDKTPIIPQPVDFDSIANGLDPVFK